jgi:hypothetical protein
MRFMFFHAVYFYPREDAQPGDAEALAAGCRTLSAIPGLTFFQVGHAAGTPREVVDNTYAVALLTAFADVAGHDVYQDHPVHLAFIAAHKHLWSRVQVYDSIVE